MSEVTTETLALKHRLIGNLVIRIEAFRYITRDDNTQQILGTSDPKVIVSLKVSTQPLDILLSLEQAQMLSNTLVDTLQAQES